MLILSPSFPAGYVVDDPVVIKVAAISAEPVPPYAGVLLLYFFIGKEALRGMKKGSPFCWAAFFKICCCVVC